MGIISESLTGLIDLEKEYGNQPEGVVLIDGVIEDTLNLIQWPFQISIINLNLERAEMEAYVEAIRVRVRTYIDAIAPVPVPEEPPAGG